VPKYKIPVEIEVDDEWVQDVICTVVEGGISYWCPCITPIGDTAGKAVKEAPIPFSEICASVLLLGGSLLLHAIESDDRGHEEEYALTLEKLLKGAALWAKARLNDAASLGELFSFDPGDIDADAADCIVQFGLFGKLVYS
jgi:hypothetical protein